MHKPIYWHHGLFLQPQHFQYQDQALHATIDKVWKTLAGDSWGVLSVRLDGNLLVENIVQVQAAELVFQDGTWVQVPDTGSVTPLVLTSEAFGSDSELIVYLALPKHRLNLKALGQRYLEAESPVAMPDRYQGGDPIDIPVLTHSLRIALKYHQQSSGTADEVRYLQPEEQAIAIARLVWRNDRIEQDADFIPPSLAIAGVPALKNLLGSLLKELLDRCRQLEDYKGGLENGEFSSRIFRFRLALQTLSRYTAQLDHLGASRRATPDDLYLCLKQLLAEVSVFTSRSDVLGQRGGESGTLNYEHSKADRSFKQLKERLLETLNELSVRPERLVRLAAVGEDRLQAALPSDFAKNLQRVFMIVRSDAPVSDWRDDLLEFAKLAPANLLPTLLDKAIPGIEIVAEPGRPEGLPQRPNSWYFRLNLDSAGDLLQAIKQGEDLVLYWRDRPDDISVELVQLKG
jgi:type VI secretion system protein ImpJ